jgi:hypothetical protein
MNLRAVICAALALAVSMSMPAPAFGKDPRSTEALAAIRSAVERWIIADELSESFEVQKVRWGTRADDPSAQRLKLELRFVTQGTDQGLEDRRFLQRLKEYRGTAGVTLPEALFYKLVHVAQIPRADAYVAIGVLSRTFETLRDQDSGRIVFRETGDRLIRRPLMLQGSAEPGPERKAEASLRAGAGSNDVARRVQRYLQDYFSLKNRAAGLNPPQLHLKPIEQDYVGIEVEGIRRVVVTDKTYWEQLQISIEIRTDGAERRAICYLDGKYASGIGSRLPAADAYTDLDPAFRPELERFVDTLLRGLQEHLASDSN